MSGLKNIKEGDRECGKNTVLKMPASPEKR